MSDENKIVITGLGLITSIGIGKNEFWNNLIKGQTNISPVSAYDTSEYDTHYGGEIKNFDYKNYIPEIKDKSYGLASIMGIVAAKFALYDAGLSYDKINKNRIGVIVGSTGGESKSIEIVCTHLAEQNNFTKLDKNIIKSASPSSVSANISSYFNFSGYANTIGTACSAGNYAIINAFNRLKKNEEDIIIAGGVDVFSIFAYAGFSRLKSTAPEKCRPFDKNRKGIIVAEGAGFLILETLEHALKRNAYIYAEVAGYGLTCDAFHITGSDEEGLGASKSMKKCMEMSKIKIDEVDYISAHGTGTQRNDKIETLAIKKVFGDYAYKIPISSIKSMLGHSMGAASSIEAAATCLVLKNNIIPPTINYEEKDPECDLDYVPNTMRKKNVNIAISNSFAFGGNNATICLKKLN